MVMMHQQTKFSRRARDLRLRSAEVKPKRQRKIINFKQTKLHPAYINLAAPTSVPFSPAAFHFAPYTDLLTGL